MRNNYLNIDTIPIVGAELLIIAKEIVEDKKHNL